MGGAVVLLLWLLLLLLRWREAGGLWNGESKQLKICLGFYYDFELPVNLEL